MKELTGQQLYNITREIVGHPDTHLWEECTQGNRDLHDKVANAVNKQLAIEEMQHLLIDYKAHLERVYKELYRNAGDSEGLEIINAQLLERGASLGLWASKEAEEMRNLVFAKFEAALDPLNEWKRVCGILPFDAAKLLACYSELFARLPVEYCEEGVKIQDDLDRLEEVANQHGLEFRNHACRFELVEMEQ